MLSTVSLNSILTFETTGTIPQEAAQSSNVHFEESIEADEIISNFYWNWVYEAVSSSSCLLKKKLLEVKFKSKQEN